ncbi:hypothetical protein Hdeb2414_s0002g00069321 [Helianthus debilis subsp. tardiflorus]
MGSAISMVSHSSCRFSYQGCAGAAQEIGRFKEEKKGVACGGANGSVESLENKKRLQNKIPSISKVVEHRKLKP